MIASLCNIDSFQMWIGVFLTPKKEIVIFLPKIKIFFFFFWEFFLSVDLNNFCEFLISRFFLLK